MLGARDPLGLVGQVLDGQYRVDEFVGEGGFSVVYRGFHTGLGEIIAIKCLKLQTQLQLGSALVESFVRRFRDEGRILYRLSQGNLHIVRSIASGTTIAPVTGSLVPYTVLEWLEGHSLAQDFDRRRAAAMKGRTPMEAAMLFSTAFEAVAYAHDQGVVHRDLNPGNIFLTQTREGVRAKVLDFGVAKIVSDHALELGPRAATIGQIRMFSPAYAAPEQFDEKLGNPGPYTDVYTIALVFVEALRDVPAIEGDNIAALIDQALNPNRRPTPRTLGVDVPDALENVFVRALAIKPETRPQNAGQLWVEIAAALKIRNIVLPVPSQLLKTPPPTQALPRAAFGTQTVRMESVVSTSAPTVAMPMPVAPRQDAFASTVAAASALVANPSQNDGQFSATMIAPDLTQPPQQQQRRQQPPQTVAMQGPSAWAGKSAEPSAPQMFQAQQQQQQQQQLQPQQPRQPSNPQFPPPPIVAIARDANASGGFNDATNVINVPKSNAPILILVVIAVLGIAAAAFIFRAKLFPSHAIPSASASGLATTAPSASAIPTAQASASSTVAPQAPATASSETAAVDTTAPTQAAAPTQTAAPAASDAPHASAAASHEAAPHASATPSGTSSDPNAFDAAEAERKLKGADSILVSCGDAKGQKGVAHVTFDNDGSVQKVVVDPPLGGTPGGDCVGSRYKAVARAPKYLGPPATVDHKFSVPK